MNATKTKYGISQKIRSFGFGTFRFYPSIPNGVECEAQARGV